MRLSCLAALLALAAPVLAAVRVQFVVLAPDLAHDQPERVFLSSSLDGWAEQGRPAPRVAPGVYALMIELEPGTELEYKLTRAGSWGTVEKSGTGQELPNRRLTVGRDIDEQVVVVQVQRWADRDTVTRRRIEAAVFGEPSTPAPRGPSVTGTVRYHHAFYSPQLDNVRTIMVWLPPGYDEQSARRYPVLYFQDGQNVFDASTSFAGEWRADETAAKLIAAGRLPPIIIVGVYNTPERIAEYSTVPDPQHGGGRGDAYLAFLVESVKPYIDRTYRTRPEREHTAVAGASLAAPISIEALLRRPDVFGAAAGLSTAAWWADGALAQSAAEHKPATGARLWLDVDAGAAEAGNARNVESARALVAALEAGGLRREAGLHYEEIAGGQHNEAAWSARLDQVLRFLFAADR